MLYYEITVIWTALQPFFFSTRFANRCSQTDLNHHRSPSGHSIFRVVLPKLGRGFIWLSPQQLFPEFQWKRTVSQNRKRVLFSLQSSAQSRQAFEQVVMEGVEATRKKQTKTEKDCVKNKWGMFPFMAAELCIRFMRKADLPPVKATMTTLASLLMLSKTCSFLLLLLLTFLHSAFNIRGWAVEKIVMLNVICQNVFC